MCICMCSSRYAICTSLASETKIKKPLPPFTTDSNPIQTPVPIRECDHSNLISSLLASSFYIQMHQDSPSFNPSC